MWSELDRTIAVAWFEYLDGLCSCGTPRDEGWSIDNEFAWKGEVVHCWVCAAQDRARERHENADNPEMHGVKAIATRRD